MSHPFQLVAGHVALDFANTLDFRFDPCRTVDLLPSYDRFVDFALQSGLITPAHAARLSDESMEISANGLTGRFGRCWTLLSSY